MIVGGGGGVSRVVWRSFERGRHENHVFHTKKHIYNLYISLRELISLSENPLLAVIMTFCTEHNSSRVGICAERDISR